ncbi:unnamed protein product [Effrenium voratum]|uniref:DNA 3'-5' helicase n=1 Tax=Effrenium voratum TaxID=2562239 RepID=A0AA36IC69_9DINO|nr:unnamed protein product [Effrenium voratum]
MLRNEEPILGGRPLIAGPVFEFFIMNATNAESTPLLNLFQIEAMTNSALGKEVGTGSLGVWTAPGWVIYPELTLTSVQTANPGYGLPWYTNFTVTLQTVTEVPSGGSIRIIAPQDYYFGPVIETAATRYDPLVSEPSPQGAGQERPPADKAGLVPVGKFREKLLCDDLPHPETRQLAREPQLRAERMACSLEFEPCVIMNELDELITLGMVLSIAQETARVGNRTICLDLRAKCDEGGRLSDLISCQSQGSTLDLYIAPMVYVPSRRVFRFLIQGYNARNPPMNSTVNAWHFMTRNSDSENTVLDEKPQVPGVSLIGIVSVDSLVPSNTKVSSIENYVTVTLRLTTQHDASAARRACTQDSAVRLSEVQEWACGIFAAGKAKAKAKRQAEAAEAVLRGCDWPSPEQATATLAMQLDSGPIRRRATHALRCNVREALQWADRGSTAPVRLADSLSNCAVVMHIPTSAIRSLCSVARQNVGLWYALRTGKLRKHVALTATEQQLKDFGEEEVPEAERSAWACWREEGERDEPESNELPSTKLQEEAIDGELDLEAPTKMESLRPYQLSAVDAVSKASPENCCVVLPCGAGKTRVGAALAWSFLESHAGGCVVVLCLRREGIRQWARELAENWATKSCEVGQATKAGGEILRSSRVVLVTYHRMLSERRRAAKALPFDEDGIGEGGALDAEAGGAVAARFTAAPKGLLIADECHMVPAPKISELLSSLLGPRRRLVGLTATLLREGGKEEEDVPWPLLGKCVFRETFARLAPQYLAPVRCLEVSVPVVGTWRKLFQRQPLAAAVCLSSGKWAVLEHLLARHAEESLLITVERCEQARLIASMFGIIPLDGSVPAAQMKDYLERFRQRKILALVATHVLDDSADFPELSVMIQMGGHFASRRQEQQRLGRLLRWGKVKRRFWETSEARPTFYVLVHRDTVEEKMSRHRTRSVSGVEYEYVKASTLITSPESALGSGSDIFPCIMQRSGFPELDRRFQEAMAQNLESCQRLSARVCDTLPGTNQKAKRLSEVRRWLRGESLEANSSASSGPKRSCQWSSESESSESESASSTGNSEVSSLSSDAKPPAKKARKAKAKASGRGRGRGRARGTPQADADGPGTADAADALDFPDVETSAPPLAELRELGQSSEPAARATVFAKLQPTVAEIDLDLECDPRAILRITFPTEYMRGSETYFEGTSVLKRCLGLKENWKMQGEAVGLLAAARERRNRQDTISYNSVAGVLHLLPEKGMRPDVFSCGISAVTLSGLAKPLWRRAEYLLQSFSAADLQLGTVAWGTILDATSKAGIWEAALGLLTSMCLGGPVPDTHCLNVVISAAGRSQSWQQAVSLLSPRMSDEVSFNSALAALEGGNASLSWALLSQMRRLKLEPGHVTYGSCTNVLGSSHLWPDALHCLSFASWSGTAPNIITWGACANAMRGIWAKASNLLGAIRRAQLQATAPCAGAALSAAGGCRQWSQGLAQLATFAARGLATMPMLGAAMSALDGEEDAVRWRQVLEMCRAPATDMAPDLFGLGMGASACGKGGAWSRAVEVLQLTKLRRMEPSLTMCNAVLDGLDRSESWAQSLLLLRLVEGDLSVDSLSLRSLLQASEASGAAQQMPGCLARAGDWIRSEMRGLGYGRPKDEGFLLESFESILDHSCAPEDLVLALRRAVCAPATRALRRLITVSVDARQHKRSLEKQSSLGQHFTYSALGSGAFPWTFASRRAARATFGSGATGRDPAAKNLVAWTSASFGTGTASRNHGRADLEAASSAALVPVFVDHDRAPHCERQALLAHLRVLNARGLEAIEEGYPANIPLVVILGLSNPEISPTRARNVWTFEAMSLSSGQEELLNVNLNVTGFKIFGEFSGAYVTGTVLSPLAQNVVGIWFNLKSPLKASLETGQTSQMRLWLPPTFQPLPDCGTSLNLFSLSYDVGRELVKNPFPTTIAYMSMPSGSYCYDFYDDVSGQYYVELTIEQEVSYGLDYAFEFALTNPFTTPASADNVWRFETLQNGVILHLRRSVVGFELEQIKEVRVTPSDTTTLLPLHRLEFYIMSDKYIPGGSKIEITAPNGFIFTCAFFSTDEGLANTTTCYVREPNIAEFTMDTSDPKQPNSPFKLFVYVSNPEFTPQMNYWNFRIISPLAKTLDMRDFVSSFDITGRLEVDIQATFPYFGQVNPLRVVFVQSTILNQADVGNELVPPSFRVLGFSQRELLAELEKCGRSLVRFVPAEAEELRVKPPDASECSEHLELRLPGIDPPCLLQLVQEGHTGDRKRKRLEQGQLLWGSGLVLAFWLAAGSTPRRRVLELGSGLGTAGLACAMLNFHEVVLSDKPGVVFSLQRNLQLNLHLEQVKCVTLDWSQPAGLQALGVFEIIIGADILYSSTSLRPLVALLGALLAVGGRFHCVDPGRRGAGLASGPSGLEAFVALVAQEFPAWAVTVEPLEESTALAREHLCRQRILVPQQRRRGLGAALGRAVHKTLPVAQLIDADAPYQLLTVERVAGAKRNAVNQPTSNRGYDVGFVFPPEGMTCRGYDNATVSIRFPDGAGLLRNNYTLEVDVANPGYPPNSTTWSFITRVRNLDGEKIVDANRTLEGFGLIELLPMRLGLSKQVLTLKVSNPSGNDGF